MQSGSTPKIYVKAIADLEDFMNETIAKSKVSTKKMNATNARGLNAVKQRIRKNNKDYATQIEQYREDKSGFMESDEDEEIVTTERTFRPSQRLVLDDEPGDGEGFSTVGRGGKTLQYTPESILKHLRTIIESRGKKNTDRNEQIRVMERLYEVATTPYQRIRVLLALISTRFDLTTGAASFMSQEQWKLSVDSSSYSLKLDNTHGLFCLHYTRAEQEFNTLLQVLESNSDYIVIENAEEWEDDEKPPTVQAGEKLKIPGSIVSFVERLDDELTRSLQHIDPHTAEYIERLADEGALYTKIVRGMLYLERLAKDEKLQTPQESINRIIIRRLEHIYFKVWRVTTPALSLANVSILSHRKS
jgi:translation initiation factor 3 subunit C